MGCHYDSKNTLCTFQGFIQRFFLWLPCTYLAILFLSSAKEISNQIAKNINVDLCDPISAKTSKPFLRSMLTNISHDIQESNIDQYCLQTALQIVKLSTDNICLKYKLL